MLKTVAHELHDWDTNILGDLPKKNQITEAGARKCKTSMN
jgi:hypothetical protein